MLRSSPSDRFRLASLSALALVTAIGCGAASPEPARTTPAPAAASSASASPAPAEDEGGPIPITASDPKWGSRTALVTIVEMSDFQCPFCGRAEATMESIKRAYGPEKLRVVWKNMPLEFHPNARPAAEAGAAVMSAGGSEAFWKFEALAFHNQETLSPSAYEAWARAAGVDGALFQRALASGAARAKVDADLALAKSLGVMGTPQFFVNGTSVMGAQPEEAFKQAIDLEMDKARAKVASGLAPEKVYAAVAAENFKKPAPEPSEEDAPDKNVYRMPIGKSPARGASDALVTVVEFSDFQCPFCKRGEATLTELEARFPKNTLRFVWKNLPLPFHKRAEPAAELALEARAEKGDPGFWAAHDKLFDAQPQLEDADLERIAKELTLDVGKVMSAVRSHKYLSEIDADVTLADDFQANGTPHFFINGHRVVGAVPVEELATVVEGEVTRAKEALAKGIAARDVYDAVTKDGVTAPAPESATIAFAATSSPAPVLGSPKAPVSIYVFSDFQCPFCKRVEPTLAELRKAYGPKIRFVWKNLPLPFHDHAHVAAEAAMEAQAQKGDAAFWKMHDALFAKQGEGGLTREGIDEIARSMGLDAAKLTAALDSGKHKARVDADAEAASRAGINGTPAFVVVAEGAPTAHGKDGAITGYMLAGAQPLSRFKKLVDRALADGKNKPAAPLPPAVKASP